MIKLKKGLNLPMEGAPLQQISDGSTVTKVALIGDDLMGMKPSMAVNVGDKVKTGQLLFSDKKTEGVNYTSPASGEVIAINRGAKRAFQSIVVKVEGDENVSFSSHAGTTASSYNEQSLKDLLLESGAWTSLRVRPFSKVADPKTRPSSIFVTAMDSHPGAADPTIVIGNNESAFKAGLEAMTKLANKVFLCSAPGANIAGADMEGVTSEQFDGPHPAGLVGTHIHFLDPVSEAKFVWHVGYQDLIAIGKLIETGKLFTDRVIAISGPAARNPRLITTRVGACLCELTANETHDTAEIRTVSGSVFGGRKSTGNLCYLGRFHNQVTLLEEGRKREFLGWHSPGLNRFSIKPIYLSKFFPNKKYAFDTDANGSLRSIVPIGSYEKVMPHDILPTYLLRSIMSGNLDMCVKLGALELDEEDLSLCTYVDPCKNDFASKLRVRLTAIEKEG